MRDGKNHRRADGTQAGDAEHPAHLGNTLYLPQPAGKERYARRFAPGDDARITLRAYVMFTPGGGRKSDLSDRDRAL